ncbi:hypothetical protein BDP81DRAFT_68461 [Colletotrichum phormii]|uniref:Uncharacterized protein n=1 Tax=Colletotrichum phormii TaxID=359342 RepID=A0AAI9ZMW7_9PEZI|nr:uncharacterized protein BDP81DRAFT_68461 [Colletotrichum phormii]KAK1633587.1 hypothetical protein BDP81DRAFT_68461 [Colletotrichum phormii]
MWMRHGCSISNIQMVQVQVRCGLLACFIVLCCASRHITQCMTGLAWAVVQRTVTKRDVGQLRIVSDSQTHRLVASLG